MMGLRPLPTPNVRDWKDAGPNQGNRRSPNLGTMVARAPIPTPTAQDSRSSRRHGYMVTGHSGTTLTDFALGTSDSASARGTPERSLSPQFSEWLMGWPINWTCFCGRCQPVLDDREADESWCLWQHRNERLWVAGNGVVPQTAALAWRTLWEMICAD
jgi:hypothetical protein